MIFVTGDTHGEFTRFSSHNFQKGKSLSKDDFVIVCGDFGLIWQNIPSKEEKYWINWLDSKPWTTLFVDGNHSNHPRLNSLEKIEKFDGIVGKVSDSIFHLRRGEIYNIENRSVFCMGGAASYDKHLRVEGISWWKEEIISNDDINNALNHLEGISFIDIIITHTLPKNLVPFYQKEIDPTTIFLQHIFDNFNWNHWFCGHWHFDETFDKNVQVLYHKIVKV